MYMHYTVVTQTWCVQCESSPWTIAIFKWESMRRGTELIVQHFQWSCNTSQEKIVKHSHSWDQRRENWSIKFSLALNYFDIENLLFHCVHARSQPESSLLHCFTMLLNWFSDTTSNFFVAVHNISNIFIVLHAFYKTF